MIVAADLEGTLTLGETWRGLRAYLETHGRQREYRRFMRQKMPLFIAARLGIVPKRHFQNRWVEDFVQLFAGMSPESFAVMADWVVEHELAPKTRTSVLQELLAARDAGARVILASGTYQPVLEAFAQRFHFEALGTPLELRNGALSGALASPVNVGEHKRSSLLRALRGQSLTRAYGDTMPDLPMLELASEAVIVAGQDAKLERIGAARGWRITQ